MRKILLRNRRGIYLVILVGLLASLVAIAVVQELGTGSGPTGGLLGRAISLIRPALVQAATTTFPVNEAGIAAYVKLDSVDITDLTEALSFYKSITQQASTYVIGTVEVHNRGSRYSYPYVYIGLDGWIVAYYLNTEEASRIMQWNGYEKGIINTTTLQDAIDIMCANIGVTNSTAINYYDFEFPSANKMAIIAETLPTYCIVNCANSFSITIPGILYEGCYSVSLWGWNSPSKNYPTLAVDGTIVFTCDDSDSWIHYGYYDPSTHLEVNEPHFVTLSTYNYCNGDGAATILIYQN